MKDNKNEWTSNCNTAFGKIKHALVYTPVLAMPDFNSDFHD